MLTQAEGRPKWRGLGEGGNLNQSLVNKHFVPIHHLRQSSSTNHLGGKEWEFGGSVSGLSSIYKWGILESYLNHG